MTLVEKYFGKYLEQLRTAAENDSFRGRFVNIVYSPEALEKRLHRIENCGLTQAVVQEVGDIQDLQELDRRLMDAWAEIRTIDQLIREGFSDIAKTKETADFTAARDDRNYAFQVTRINSSLASQVERRNPQGKRSTSPYGALSEIYDRLDGPLSWFFWQALEWKNAKFKNWNREKGTRCIVIVSSDGELQDSLIRHISCQQIKKGIGFLWPPNFEELLWLQDLGNGAQFMIGDTPLEIRCLADWNDNPGDMRNAEDRVLRREVDLDSIIPIWKEQIGN